MCTAVIRKSSSTISPLPIKTIAYHYSNSRAKNIMQTHCIRLPSSSIPYPAFFSTSKPATHGKPAKTKPVVAACSCSFTISDTELERQGFTLHRTADDLNLDELNNVFARVGFPRREPARIRRALTNTQHIIWLSDKNRAGAPPVAFARAAGDGVFNAVVWDVVVDPTFQGLGLGKAVMERLVADLRRAGVCNIALYAEPRVIGFYRPLGFVSDPDGIKGMVYSRQKKR